MGEPERWTRRQLLRRAWQAAATCGLAGAGTYGYARGIEPGWLDIVRHDLPLRHLPDAFAGFTIAQLSDIHFGPYMDPGGVAPALQAVLNLEPDAIVLTGDFVTRLDRGEPEMITQALVSLDAPQGVFAVLGNHDWWENSWVVARSLKQAGITVLQNEHVGWQRGGQTLYLAGVDDIYCGRHDLRAALAGLSGSASVVLLAHEPDYADTVAQEPRVRLQLSGHSHGGQVCLPGIGGLHYPRLGRKYPAGLRQLGDLTLYTNRGVGMSSVPLRFCCRPELTLFTLQPTA